MDHSIWQRCLRNRQKFVGFAKRTKTTDVFAIKGCGVEYSPKTNKTFSFQNAKRYHTSQNGAQTPRKGAKAPRKDAKTDENTSSNLNLGKEKVHLTLRNVNTGRVCQTSQQKITPKTDQVTKETNLVLTQEKSYDITNRNDVTNGNDVTKRRCFQDSFYFKITPSLVSKSRKNMPGLKLGFQEEQCPVCPKKCSSTFGLKRHLNEM